MVSLVRMATAKQTPASRWRERYCRLEVAQTKAPRSHVRGQVVEHDLTRLEHHQRAEAPQQHGDDGEGEAQAEVAAELEDQRGGGQRVEDHRVAAHQHRRVQPDRPQRREDHRELQPAAGRVVVPVGVVRELPAGVDGPRLRDVRPFVVEEQRPAVDVDEVHHRDHQQRDPDDRPPGAEPRRLPWDLVGEVPREVAGAGPGGRAGSGRSQVNPSASRTKSVVVMRRAPLLGLEERQVEVAPAWLVFSHAKLPW